MILPDTIIIDLKQINKICKDLVSFLKQIKKTVKKSPMIDIGNDIEYSIKSLQQFKKSFNSLIEKESKKYNSDILGNTFKPLKKYQYAELLFSERYKNITSLRLLGYAAEKQQIALILARKAALSGEEYDPYIRYVFFNIENIFDPTTINLIKNYNNLMDEQKTFKEDKNYLEILQEYFAPSPILISDEKRKKLINISLKFDDKSKQKNKTFEDVLKENVELNSGDIKSSIYKANEQSERPVDDIMPLVSQAEDIKLRIEQLQEDNDYMGVIDLVHSEMIDKFNMPDLFQFVDENLKIVPDPKEFLSSLPTTELLKKIDEEIPAKERKKIYKKLKEELSKQTIAGKPLSIANILEQLQNFINSKLPNGNKISLTEKEFKNFTSLLNNLKDRFPTIYCEIETFINVILPSVILVGIILLILAAPFLLSLIKPIKVDPAKILSGLSLNIDIKDLFGDFSTQIDNNILSYISCVLCMLTKALLELLNKCNLLDDFALENMFPLPELKTTPEKSKFESLSEERWTKYIEYAYNLLVETDAQRTEPQVISPQLDPLKTNDGIRKKLISKNNPHINPLEAEVCEQTANLVAPKKINKKQLKNLRNKTLSELAQNKDIDSITEKIKNYCYTGTDNYFSTQNLEDPMIVDVLRFVASSLRQQSPLSSPVLPISSQEIKNSMSRMVEQIETILDEQEVNSLLNGSYTHDTAQIVKNIAKLNFPTLTDRVDPIKYFRMLGKVVGSTNKINLSNIKNNIDLNILGVKL